MSLVVSSRATQRGIEQRYANANERVSEAVQQAEQRERQAQAVIERHKTIHAELDAVKAENDHLRYRLAHHENVRVNSGYVARLVAKQHGYTFDDLKGHSRGGKLAAARQHAMYEIHRLCPHVSKCRMAEIFGGRDHTTVIHGIRAWPKKAAKLGIEVLPLGRERGGE